MFVHYNDNTRFPMENRKDIVTPIRKMKTVGVLKG